MDCPLDSESQPIDKELIVCSYEPGWPKGRETKNSQMHVYLLYRSLDTFDAPNNWEPIIIIDSYLTRSSNFALDVYLTLL